jgi:hypothetical protein
LKYFPVMSLLTELNNLRRFFYKYVAPTALTYFAALLLCAFALKILP